MPRSHFKASHCCCPQIRMSCVSTSCCGRPLGSASPGIEGPEPLRQGLQRGVGSSPSAKNTFCHIKAPNTLSFCATCPIKVPSVLGSLNAAMASPRGHWTPSLRTRSGSPVCPVWGPRSAVVAAAGGPQGHRAAAWRLSPGRWCPGRSGLPRRPGAAAPAVGSEGTS